MLSQNYVEGFISRFTDDDGALLKVFIAQCAAIIAIGLAAKNVKYIVQFLLKLDGRVKALVTNSPYKLRLIAGSILGAAITLLFGYKMGNCEESEDDEDQKSQKVKETVTVGKDLPQKNVEEIKVGRDQLLKQANVLLLSMRDDLVVNQMTVKGETVATVPLGQWVQEEPGDWQVYERKQRNLQVDIEFSPTVKIESSKLYDDQQKEITEGTIQEEETVQSAYSASLVEDQEESYQEMPLIEGTAKLHCLADMDIPLGHNPDILDKRRPLWLQQFKDNYNIVCEAREKNMGKPGLLPNLTPVALQFIAAAATIFASVTTMVLAVTGRGKEPLKTFIEGIKILPKTFVALTQNATNPFKH